MPSPATIRSMNEAVAHHQAGRFAEAEQIYRRVLAADPRDFDALQLLGLLHHQAGRNQQAVELINKAIAIKPRPEFYVNLSQAYRALGDKQASLDACARAAQIAPSLPEAWNNYGLALSDVGQQRAAIDAFHRALALRPNYLAALNNLANAFAALNDVAAAEATFRRAIAIDANYAEAYSNFSHFLSQLSRYDETIAAAERAIALRPTLIAAYMNLGTALHIQGRLDEGNAAYERGLAIDPTHAGLWENLLGAFNYSTRFSQAQSLEAHLNWAQRFAKCESPLPHDSHRNTNRRLRIGYVSADFKRHAVASFFEPIVTHHDRGRFEVFAYSNVKSPDEITTRLKDLCDQWRDITSLGDDEAAALIRRDQIDVLIDLAGHTIGNRLEIFARKPVPVQMTYLGYPNTSGISAIDYRITDALADPIGMTEAGYCERLLRIDPPFLCYRPSEVAPPIAPPPVLKRGHVTFGSFNKIAKAGAETIALWAELLHCLPTARLLLKSVGLGGVGSRRRLFDAFAAHGIGPDRIDAIEADQPLADHLAMYSRIDIALDTFPYHGTTTTCDALWMGVPVITLAGGSHVSRVGVTLLNSIGKPEWVAADSESYVRIAAQFAADAPQLASIRAALRADVARSSLLDGARLTRALEQAYCRAYSAWAEHK